MIFLYLYRFHYIEHKYKPMNALMRIFRRFITYRFNLQEDKAEETEIVASIKKGVEFKGANLWTLIFAVFVASIGLNVNSTAVIIGAMLISPLMGPIMGIGLGIGINDFDLVKKGLRNLLIATLFSIATSTFYFWITPLHIAQSELLARTSPTIWDVFIAFLGGLAGIVAGTRKEKGNVIPGVAIATALMPPLCTAGFGLATGNMYYFIGAIYLYFINSVFICIATLLIVRYLKFHKKEFEDKASEKKKNRYMLIVVIITAAPSIYLAYRIVDKSIFETNAEKFVQGEFRYKYTQVVSKNYKYDSKSNEIDLLLIGRELSQAHIDSLKNKLPQYNLADTRLSIRQGLNARQEVDFSQIRASILEDVLNKQDSVNGYNAAYNTSTAIPDIGSELKALYPSILNYSLSTIHVHRMDTTTQDTLTLLTASFTKPLPKTEQNKLRNWVKNRIKADSVKLLLD